MTVQDPTLGCRVHTAREHSLGRRVECFTRSLGKCSVNFVNVVSRFGSLTTCTRVQARAGSRYPFLTQKERDIETGLDYFGSR